jgi:hypothetical protein
MAKRLSPAQQDPPQPQLATSNENQAPASSAGSPNVAAMKSSNVKFGFSKFGFSFSKPKAASPKPVKSSSVPSALGSPIAAAVATPRLPELATVEEVSSAVIDKTAASSTNSAPLEAPAANHDTAAGHIAATSSAAATAHAPVAAPDGPSDAKVHHVVGLSARAQQLMAELAAEDQSFGALDFLEPVKKEKRVLIEKSNLVRKNVKVGHRLAPVPKSDPAEAVSTRANLIKPPMPQTQVPAPAAAAPAIAPADCKQVEQLKRVIDNLKAQLEAARTHEKKVVALENQLAEQNGVVEGMRKEIRQEAPCLCVVVLIS